MDFSALSIIIIIYLFVIVLISWYSRSQSFKDFFSLSKKSYWWLAGISLLVNNMMFFESPYFFQLMATKGYSATWMLRSGLLAAGILPILFAPLWAKMKFITDNQFILFRFSGRSARVLHFFRGAYVGYFIAAIISAIISSAFIRFLMAFTGLEMKTASVITFVILLLLLWKNTLKQKLRTDLFHGIVIMAGLLVSLFFFSSANGGLKAVYSYLQTNQYEQIQLFPSAIKNTSSLAWHNFIVYFVIQWWSVQILDGSGPEAQRFINVKSGFDAFKAAILPVVLSLLLFVPLYISFDVAWVQALKNPELISFTADGTPNYELFYFSTMVSLLPGFAGALFFLVMLIFFINLQEYFLNWGAGFITIDLFKTYLRKKSSDKELRIIGYFAMLLIAITSIIFTYYRDTTLGLQELFLAMGAGVGPVFILRWFIGRINAWSQLSAMLSSLIFTFSYDAMYQHWPAFHSFIYNIEQRIPMDFFTLKILLLTSIVSTIWILVTFLTPPDEFNHLKTFAETVKPGGIWPEGINAGKRNWTKYFLLLVLYAIMATLPFVFLWYIRFGSISISIVLVLIYFGLFVLIWRSMRKNLKFEK